MNKLIEYVPLVTRVLQAIFDGIRNGESDEEIRRRVADPNVILASDLKRLRDARRDLDDYVERGR
jgi:hypothetical protein